MFWRYFFASGVWLHGAIVFMIISAISGGLLSLKIKPAFDSVLTAGVRWGDVYTFLGQIMLIFCGKGIGQLGERICVARIVNTTINRLQSQLMQDILKKPFGFFHVFSSGELVSRVVGDLSQTRQHLINILLIVGKDILAFIVLTGVLFWMDWRLTCWVFLMAPVVAIPLILIARHMRRMTEFAQMHNGQLAGQLGEIFTYIKTIKVFGAQPYAYARFDRENQKVSRFWDHAFWVNAWGFPLLEIAAGLILCGILAYGVWAIKAGRMTIGGLVGFMGTLLFVYESVKRLLYANGPIQEVRTMLGRVEMLLEADTSQLSFPRKREPSNMDPRLRGDDTCGVTFQNVSFTYDKFPILDNFNLVIPAGKRIALMGKSGCGKTTVCDLLVGLYELTSGMIYVDDVPIRDLDEVWLNANIAYLPQESAVFNLAVEENFWDDSRIVDQLLSSLELDPHTNATVLSGGEKRRLALCRLLLKDSLIYILDEPLAGLDPINKEIVSGLIDTLTKGKTTIIISHDPLGFVDETYTL